MSDAGSGPGVPGSVLRGRISGFDGHVGLGTVLGDDGGAYPFHCTAIADGSRLIDAGTVVTFTVEAARLGRLEAGSIRPV